MVEPIVGTSDVMNVNFYVFANVGDIREYVKIVRKITNVHLNY